VVTSRLVVRVVALAVLVMEDCVDLAARLRPDFAVDVEVVVELKILNSLVDATTETTGGSL
jgi:hypothetical protein